MTLSEQFLHSISNPTIAYLLITVGLLGIVFEIASPGAIIPGVMGGVAIALGIVSLGNFDANWVGLLFMALAFALFAIDLHAPSHGLLSGAAVASFALGSFLLKNSSHTASASISRFAVLAVTALMTAFFLFATGAVLRTRLQRSTTGKEGMRGAVGIVREPLDPEGYIFVVGELWRAQSIDGSIPVGDFVRVIDVEGLTLLVEPEIDYDPDLTHGTLPRDTHASPINSVPR